MNDKRAYPEHMTVQRVPFSADATVLVSSAILCLVIYSLAYGIGQAPLAVPLSYDGDALSYAFLMESFSAPGGLGHVSNAGGLFGTQLLDFPNADYANLLLSQFLAADGMFGERYNRFILLSVLTTAGSGYVCARMFGLSPVWAAVAAVAFTLLPFHFLRTAHLFYTNYSAAAVAFCIALVAAAEPGSLARGRRSRIAGAVGFVLACLWCSATGVYYAFFSCLLIASAGLMAALHHRSRRPVSIAAIAVLLICVGMATQLVPTLLQRNEAGPNLRVAERGFQESELYGLRLTQLVLPVSGHRVQKLADLRARYDSAAPNVNENATATLGLVLSAGLALGFAILLLPTVRERLLPWRFQLAAGAAMLLFLYGTIGGLGSAFALTVSPQIRALNRISPFIALLCALIFAGTAQALVDRLGRRWAHYMLASVVVVVVILDQVPFRFDAQNSARQDAARRFASDREFAKAVEGRLLPGTAVLQLPYVEYPESASSIGDSTQLRNALHAPGLRWTHGAMKGRPEATWIALVAKLPPAQFASTLVESGFGAVVVDNRGRDEAVTSKAQAFAEVAGAAKFDSPDGTQTAYTAPAPIRVRARPIAPGQGWYPIEDANGQLWLWASGDAELVVASPSEAKCMVEVNLTALASQTVSIQAEGKALASYSIAPGRDQVVRIVVPPGVAKIALKTSRNPSPPGNGDPRLLSFQWKLTSPPLCRPL